MVDVCNVVEALPSCRWVFWICVGIGGNFDEVHVTFEGLFCVGADCLQVVCALLGIDDTLEDLFMFVIIIGGAVEEAREEILGAMFAGVTDDV